jgi:hypothetical protein
MFENLLKSQVTIVILSIIWGLGLSTVFRRACHGRKCQVILYNGPDPIEIEHNVYEYGDGQCYRYSPYLSQCEL